MLVAASTSNQYRELYLTDIHVYVAEYSTCIDTIPYEGIVYMVHVCVTVPLWCISDIHGAPVFDLSSDTGGCSGHLTQHLVKSACIMYHNNDSSKCGVYMYMLRQHFFFLEKKKSCLWV